MWQIIAESPNDVKINVSFFKTIKELGIFLQNFDYNKFKIKQIFETEELFSVEDSQYFINKPKGLETGGKK